MSSSARRVLVVDDMNAVRSVICALLKNEGYEALAAASGQLALDLLAKGRFDLVLSDWNMPGMNGATLVGQIRALHARLPIVMITAENDPKRIVEMRDLGVNGYLLKPFKPAALLAVVDKVLPRR
ncbi:response regulator [Zoogloea sp.]|uniref:response regulator n=1 Tax=Zoogloea sp. TaxID=49181 RepID=UPI0035B1A078